MDFAGPAHRPTASSQFCRSPPRWREVADVLNDAVNVGQVEVDEVSDLRASRPTLPRRWTTAGGPAGSCHLRPVEHDCAVTAVDRQRAQTLGVLAVEAEAEVADGVRPSTPCTSTLSSSKLNAGGVENGGLGLVVLVIASNGDDRLGKKVKVPLVRAEELMASAG
jgi:hypothetical protein